MIARADFGWIIFVAFAFWLLQVLRAGGRRAGGTSVPPRAPSSPRDATQREGAELDELLRHLERRLGTAGAKKEEPRPKPAQPASLEGMVDRAAEAEAIERRRVELAAARDRELTEADHAAFEARIRGADARAGARAAGPHITARQLRDAVLWREILGLPVGLRE